MRIHKLIIIYFCLFFWVGALMSSPTPWQENRTELVGTVSLGDGTVLPGVAVEITSLSSGERRVTLTNETGYYRFKNIPPGEYKVISSLEGFKTKESIVTIVPGSSRSLSFFMSSGGIDEDGGRYVSVPSSIKTQEIVLMNNQGIELKEEKAAPKGSCHFFYNEKKMFAKHGIAKVGDTKKDLDEITNFPHESEDYIKIGLKIIPRIVYVIKLDAKGKKLLFIRILEIGEGKVKIEYHQTK